MPIKVYVKHPDDPAVVVWCGSKAHPYGGYVFAKPEAPRPRPEPDDDVLPGEPPAARRRGRPARAGEKAVHRVELRLTLPELRALRRLAASNRHSLADEIRITMLDYASEGTRQAIVSGRDLLNCSR